MGQTLKEMDVMPCARRWTITPALKSQSLPLMAISINGLIPALPFLLALSMGLKLKHKSATMEMRMTIILAATLAPTTHKM